MEKTMEAANMGRNYYQEQFPRFRISSFQSGTGL